MAIILGAFGAICFASASSNNDLLVRYDDKCNGLKVCSISFTPTVDLKKPKFYYQLENFYANHRNFVKSRSYKQLRGNMMTDSELGSICDPVKTMGKLGDKIPKVALDKTVLRSDNVAFPCGLIAKYFFNDTF